MYSQKFLELITNPMNQGKMQNSDGEGTVEDPQSGANCTIDIKVEFGIIKSISFWVSGDKETIACCSMTTILAKGKHLAEALKITKQDVKDALEWSVEADHPGIDLALGTLRKTIENYLLRRGIYHIQFGNFES